MILGFKTQIDGEPTHFVQKILACKLEEYKKVFKPKLHSIRKVKRWKPGNSIQMATGVRTKKYFQFNGGGIGLDVCKSVQDIRIVHSQFDGDKGLAKGRWVFIDDIEIGDFWLHELAVNDGFKDADEFFAWFNEDFEGQIIHWTDYEYLRAFA